MTGLDVSAPPVPRSEEVLTPEALAFVADLDARFHDRRDELLAARRSRREEIARTGRLDFLPDTADVRDSEWTVAPVPADLLDRRVEITGPTDPKMAINALNSGARVWLADLEDAGLHLGWALASVVNLLNPGLVVVGGDMARAGELLLESARIGLRRHALDAVAATPVEASELGERASLVGAVLLAAERTEVIASGA